MTEVDGYIQASEADLIQDDGANKESGKSSFVTIYEIMALFFGFAFGALIGGMSVFYKMDQQYNTPTRTHIHPMIQRSTDPMIHAYFLNGNMFFFGFTEKESLAIQEDHERALKLIAIRLGDVEKKTGLKASWTKPIIQEVEGKSLLVGAIVGFDGPSESKNLF
jgi:hypothetical protein